MAAKQCVVSLKAEISLTQDVFAQARRATSEEGVYIGMRLTSDEQQRSMTEKDKSGAIAQLGEHLLCKQGVVGSIPTGSTNSLVISRE